MRHTSVTVYNTLKAEAGGLQVLIQHGLHFKSFSQSKTTTRKTVKKKKFLGMKWVLGESMVETVPSIVCLSLLPWNGFLKDSVHIIFQYSSVDMDQEYRL